MVRKVSPETMSPPLVQNVFLDNKQPTLYIHDYMKNMSQNRDQIYRVSIEEQDIMSVC